MSDTKVWAVLIIPHEGDPNNMLIDGVCGAAPPRAIWNHTCHIHNGWLALDAAWVYETSDCNHCGPVTRALTLAWDDSPVPEGLNRYAQITGVRPLSVWRLIRDLLDGGPISTAWASFGTIILLNEDKEGIPQ